MTPPYGLFAGLALAVAAGAVFLSAALHQLCVNGHPAPRPSDVTYGGLPPHPGYERDHHRPALPRRPGCAR
jgi:hypothetical protein